MNLVKLHSLSLAAATLLTASLCGQTVEPTQDTVELSKFEVSAKANRGYATTSSLSASRIAVPITELPSTVVVINEKLIADTVAIDLRDTVGLVSGVQQSATPQENNSITMRGYGLSSAQRDGVADYVMAQNGGFDYALIERIEVVKGPSGILYGAHSPGGVLNFVSKRPLYVPKTKIDFMAGSYEAYRASLDTSSFFDQDKRFGYRLVAVRANTEGQNNTSKTVGDGLTILNPSVSYRSKSGWDVWAWGAVVRDHMRRMNYGTPVLPTASNFSYPSNPSTTGAPLYDVALNHILRGLQYFDSNNYELGVSKSFTLGRFRIDMRLLGRDYSQDGTNSERIRTVDAFDILLDKDDNLIGTDFRAVPYASAVGKVAKIGRTAIRYDVNPVRTGGRIGSADFNIGFNLGPTRHQLLVYATSASNEQTSNSSYYDIRNAATLASLGVPIINGKPFVQYWPTPVIIPTVAQMIQLSDARNVAKDLRIESKPTSYGAIERLSFWNDRVFAVAGWRHDVLDTTTGSIVNDQLVSPKYDKTEVNTTAFSGLAKLYKGSKGEASLYVNSNETFIPVTTIDQRLATFGQKYPNRIASNDEFGVKLDMWQSRLVATIAMFKTSETNVLVSEQDETGAITGKPQTYYNTPIGVRTTRGWDMDVNFAPVQGLEVILTYAKLNPRLENGLYAQNIPFHTLSGAVRYEFTSGRAKGLSLMWQYNKWGQSALSSRSYWIIPGGDLHTAVVGYQFNRNWVARFRVENVLDQRGVYPSANETALDITRNRNYRLGVSYTY